MHLMSVSAKVHARAICIHCWFFQGVRYTALEGEVDPLKIAEILNRYFGTRTSWAESSAVEHSCSPAAFCAKEFIFRNFQLTSYGCELLFLDELRKPL